MVSRIHTHQQGDKLGREVTGSILVFHCLTGCDSTSSFSEKGRGKLEAWTQFVAITLPTHMETWRQMLPNLLAVCMMGEIRIS